MNAAWGGICDDTQISMCLSAEHKTVKNILTRGAFTVSMADAAHVTECDYAVSYTHLDVYKRQPKGRFELPKILYRNGKDRSHGCISHRGLRQGRPHEKTGAMARRAVHIPETPYKAPYAPF